MKSFRSQGPKSHFECSLRPISHVQSVLLLLLCILLLWYYYISVSNLTSSNKWFSSLAAPCLNFHILEPLVLFPVCPARYPPPLYHLPKGDSCQLGVLPTWLDFSLPTSHLPKFPWVPNPGFNAAGRAEYRHLRQPSTSTSHFASEKAPQSRCFETFVGSFS